MYMTPAELRASARLFAPLFKSYGWLLAARSSELVVNSCNSMVINLNTWLFSGERLSGVQQAAKCALPCPCSTACSSRNRDFTVCRSGIGATSSLPVALAKVRSQSDLPTFVIARCRTAVCGVHVRRPGQPPEGELDGSEGHEGDQSFRKVLEVLGETPVTL